MHAHLLFIACHACHSHWSPSSKVVFIWWVLEDLYDGGADAADACASPHERQPRRMRQPDEGHRRHAGALLHDALRQAPYSPTPLELCLSTRMGWLCARHACRVVHTTCMEEIMHGCLLAACGYRVTPSPPMEACLSSLRLAPPPHPPPPPRSPLVLHPGCMCSVCAQ